MTEEDVKIHIVMPRLRALGLQEADLSFEGSFRLRVGTHHLSMGTRRKPNDFVGARYDILVKSRGLNLMIIEVKEPAKTLTDEDRDQAISYARLVHPIAPYAVVTNGTEWRLFDTITRGEISPNKLEIRNGYKIILPASERDAAAELFLGYSAENLLTFCEAQVKEQMNSLEGSPHDLLKKYIPQLTVSRDTLEADLAAFERGGSSAFLVLADSGAGKTSALCDYTHRRLKAGKPTLFFSGARIEGSLLASIQAEFGWVFSEELTPVALIRRLSGIVGETPLIVVVDAIDEWSYGNKAQNLLALLKGSQPYSIKFVLSCRTNAWDDISLNRGSDIGITSYLHPAFGGTRAVGHRLERLTDKEFFGALEKYRESFEVHGGFEDEALDEARDNPFLLRVMFSVAAELKLEHITFSSREFFERYWDLQLAKTGDKNRASAQLCGIASLMYTTNSGRVSDRDIRKALGMSATDTLSPALFHQNLLQRTGDTFSFYFQHLRDFLIAFKVLNWPDCPPGDFARVERKGVHLDVLTFYFRYATQAQLKVIAEAVWDNAHSYLSTYERLSKTYLGAASEELVPGEGPLGFIAEYVVHGGYLGVYGFRRRKPKEPPVLLVPVSQICSRSNLLTLAGAERMAHYGSADGLRAPNITREVIENEIGVRIREWITERMLSLKGCPKLAEEVVVAAVMHNRRTFAPLFHSHPPTLCFPFSVDDVLNALTRSKLTWHFESQRVAEKIKIGEIKQQWYGDGGVSHSWDLSDEDERQIAAKVDAAMLEKRVPQLTERRTDYDDIDKVFRRTSALEQLTTISKFPWFTEYGLLSELRVDLEKGSALVREYFRRFYTEYLHSYQTLVDVNFPNLKHSFNLRAHMPIRLFVGVQVERHRQKDFSGRLLTVFEQLPEGDSNEVVVSPMDEFADERENGVFYQGRRISDACTVSVDAMRRLHHPGDATLTNRICDRLEKEWSFVVASILLDEGVPIRGVRPPPRISFL